MLKVIIKDFIKSEYVGILLLFYHKLISATKKEPLCIVCGLYRYGKDQRLFIFIEDWPDLVALDAQYTKEHFTRF
ncbi:MULTISPECIES: putative quinol monooxygenase [Enterobacter]|uniref:putative quinol monooxygenase n=1 Tax=Enterobacter TaxID=547 RepID=UPI003752DDF1